MSVTRVLTWPVVLLAIAAASAWLAPWSIACADDPIEDTVVADDADIDPVLAAKKFSGSMAAESEEAEPEPVVESGAKVTPAAPVKEAAQAAGGEAPAAKGAPKATPAAAKADAKSAGNKNKYATPDPTLELVDPRTYRLKVIMRVEAQSGPAKNVTAMGPIPMDWPEQHVKLISQKLSPQTKVSEQVIHGQAAILKLQAPQIQQGGAVFVERLYEITRFRTKSAFKGTELKLPRAAPPELRGQLDGPAPGMETDNPKIIRLVSSLHKTGEVMPWDQVKTYWSWTRDNVAFENGDFRGALFAVENGLGDCEEMSALFVGMCRLSGIPARTVWVEGHDYPEFYLLDAQGKGHWIPAQVVGPPWFGEITEYRPIFQKGDRFYDPLQDAYTRYVPHTVKVSDGQAPPKLIVDHQIIADSDINGPTYNNK